MKKASFIMLCVTLVLAAFTAGFFLGRNFSGTKLTIVGQGEIPTTTAPTAPSTQPEGSSPSDPTASAPSTPTQGADSGLLNINTATHAQLCDLPRIGEVLAQRIIDYREQNGPFQSIYQLTEVAGIGEIIMADIEDLITIGG